MRRKEKLDFSVSNALLELRMKCTRLYHKPLDSSAFRNKTRAQEVLYYCG